MLKGLHRGGVGRGGVLIIAVEHLYAAQDDRTLIVTNVGNTANNVEQRRVVVFKLCYRGGLFVGRQFVQGNTIDGYFTNEKISMIVTEDGASLVKQPLRHPDAGSTRKQLIARNEEIN